MVDVSTLADTFLMHVRALDHTARVDSSFEEMYRFLDGRLDDDDLRLFARQYSETTRIARVRGDREEFFAMLHMYLRKSRRVEEAEEMHVQDPSRATQAEWWARREEREEARKRLSTWIELFVNSLEECE